MNNAKSKKLSNQIIELLKSKGLYEESDDLLIDELVYQNFLISESKKLIKASGLLVNVRSEGPPLMQVNQALSVYRDSVKSLVTICTKLGITPQERSKLKIFEKKSEFNLTEFLSSDD